MKHTPGKWEPIRALKFGNGDIRHIIGNNANNTTINRTIAIMPTCETGKNGHSKTVNLSEKEQWANARLIAAAPELLEACKAAEHIIQEAIDVTLILAGEEKAYNERWQEERRKIRNIISKAEGKE